MHELSFETPLTAVLLARFPVFVPPFGTLIRQLAESVLTALIETLSVSLGRSLVLKNDAVWFVPAGAVEYDISLGLLAALPMLFASIDEPIGLMRRNDAARSPVEETLVDAFREAGRSRAARK